MIKPRVILSVQCGQVLQITHNITGLEFAYCDFDTMGVCENQLTPLQWPDEEKTDAIVTTFTDYKGDGHLTDEIWQQIKNGNSQEAPEVREKWHCKKCDGTNVEIKTWIEPNTGDSRDEEIQDSDTWCQDCEDHTGVKLK